MVMAGKTRFVALRGKIPPVVCLATIEVKVLLSVYAHFVVLGLVIMIL